MEMKFLHIIIIICLFLNGCSFVGPINKKTECEFLIDGVSPMDTLIRVNKEIKVFNVKDSRYTTLHKGYYYPAMQWEKCKYVSYASTEDLQINATNKFMNFWEKGVAPGGIQILTSEPNKTHSIWYYKSGEGYFSMIPKNGADIDFNLLIKNNL